MTIGTSVGGRNQGHGHDQVERSGWRLFGFDFAGQRYGFETALAGDFARVVVNGKAALELPAPVWHALLDAVELQRRHERRAATSHLPGRARAAWSAVEDEQLTREHQSNLTLEEMAATHERTRGAIAARLEQLGLVAAAPVRALSVNEPLSH